MRRVALLIAICSAPALAGETFPGFAQADAEIDRAIADGLIPGAVLLIGHDGQVTYRKAYGWRALVPRREPMTVDTVFDAASLTKILATTSCLMKLFEEGRIRLNDPVTHYLPEFQGGHSPVTIRNLMTHFSGLRPDLDLSPPWSGYETGISKALMEKPAGPPGVRFVYSDINFILLGEIVRRLSGEPLPQYASEVVFGPLGMKDTMFQPPPALRPRIAPTEIDPATGQPLRGVVHDDTSRFMGGAAGHAGVFTTADDMARFAQMMIDRGSFGGRTIFNPLAVEKFTTPQSPADQPVLRGLGWDIDSPFSANRGELFPIGSYGHTGFTGTSLWIDPFSRTYVILLTNVVHPHRGKSLSSLRSRIATITAAVYGIASPAVQITGYDETIVGAGLHRTVNIGGRTLTGLDVLEEQHFAPLRGRHVGLITNQTGIDREGRRDIDVMRAAGLDIHALYSPEHGIAGEQDQADVANSTDPSTGVRVWSLYQSDSRRLSGEMLDGVDTVVFDIQDVGARFYTYSCTMVYAMEEAAKRDLEFMVLDRPNPVTGVHMEGPILDKGLESFTGCVEMPVRHGLTLGEIANMVNGERGLGLNLQVIRMAGWQRGFWFDSTGLAWVNPSPNMRGLNAALLYPGLALLELSPNYSVGRGTDAPFEQIGAEWMDGRRLAAWLNSREIPGVTAYPVRFRPDSSNYRDRVIEGCRFVVTDRDQFDSTRLGLEVAFAIESLWPGKIDVDTNRKLIGNARVIEDLKNGTDPRVIEAEIADTLRAFQDGARKYLLYPE